MRREHGGVLRGLAPVAVDIARSINHRWARLTDQPGNERSLSYAAMLAFHGGCLEQRLHQYCLRDSVVIQIRQMLGDW